MEPIQNTPHMLDMFTAPAFAVEKGKVSYVNQAAQQQLVCPGTDIYELLSNGTEDYAALTKGCIYLSVSIAGQRRSATVLRLEDQDVFILEEDQSEALQALALAAKELRFPLGSIYTELERLFQNLGDNPKTRELAASIDRRVNQLSRIVGNMSSAAEYQKQPSMEVRDIRAVLEEVFTQAAELAQAAGKELRFQNLSERLYCHMNTEMVERAAYNLISNALKFTPDGGWVEAKLTKGSSCVCLTVTDSGSGIPNSILANVFSRYLRAPAIEDGQYGLGLGMVLVRGAAAAHGGTVLIEQPDKGGPRITVSFSLAHPENPTLRSPIQVDYAGGRSHSLLELSDVLPTKAYIED